MSALSVPERAYGKIRLSEADGVLSITLAYPERRNAIGPRMVNELLYALADAHAADDVRVVVITGEGKAFCAGGDFAQMTAGGDETALPPKGDYADLLLAMTRAEKPIVAKVNGHAMGGGLGLVAASTLAVAATGAELGTPEVNVGLFPMMIMAVLARLVPQRRLIELMLTGGKMSTDEALTFGLLNRVVPPEALDVATGDLCAKLVDKSPSTLRLGLRAFAKQGDMTLDAALPYLSAALGEVLSTDDAREGLTAFLQKRKPNWTGK